MDGEIDQGTDESGVEAPDADFDAGFESASEQTTTPDPAAADDTSTEEAAAPAATDPAPAEETPQPKYVQVTEDQLNELLNLKNEATRKFDTAFGQLGGLKQSLERLQRETPAGQAVQVSDEDFAELKSEFPELAEMQIKGLNKVLSKMRGGGSAAPDKAVIEQIVQEQYGTVIADAREAAIDGLQDIVPNWDKGDTAKQLGEWVAKQPEDIQALANSPKVRDAAALLRKFRDRPKEAAPQTSTRQRQLQAAVTPRTARGLAPAPVEVDDFEAGFNSVNT